MVRLRMRNTALFLSFLLFFFAFGAMLPARVAHAANPVIFRGLFVGCGDYEGIDLDLAPSTINDANECCYVFSNAAYDGINRIKGKMSIAADIRKSTLTSCLNPSSMSSVFYGADSNDVSVFYFSGHGTDYDENGRPAIVLSDGSVDDLMSVDALEAALHKIPGTKVVILDSCFSGAMIGKTYSASDKGPAISKAAEPKTASPAATVKSAPTITPTLTPTVTATAIGTATPTATVVDPSPTDPAGGETAAAGGSGQTEPADGGEAVETEADGNATDGDVPEQTISPTPTDAANASPDAIQEPTAAEQVEFAQALMAPFVSADQKMQARELLSQPEYIVFTASSGYDYSYGEADGEDAMGCFTRAYTDGLGRLGQHAADGNGNKSITVDEAYDSALALYSAYYGDELGDSTAQVYPENSSFTLMKYTKNSAAATGKANKNTSIYSSTLPEKTVLYSLASGTAVNVYGTLGSFYKVSAGESYGFVYKQNIRILSGSVGTPVIGVGKAKRLTYIYSSTSTSGTKIFKLGAGNTMDILSVSGSYYIVSAAGITGCVPASAVTVVYGSLGPQPTSRYVLAVGKATEPTAIFKYASTTGHAIRTLATGARMTITSVSTNYYKVWASGTIGYVPRNRIAIVSGTLNGSTPKSANTAMNAQGEAKATCYMYSGLSTTATKLRTIYKGGRISILSVTGSFYRVLTNGKIGYVLTKYLKVVTPKYFSAAGQAKELCYIYSSNSTTSTEKLTLNSGAYVSILGVYGSFYKVTVSGVTGYVLTKCARVL